MAGPPYRRCRRPVQGARLRVRPSATSVGLFDFYDRVAGLSLGRLDTETKLLLPELLDPASTREPVTLGSPPPGRKPPQR